MKAGTSFRKATYKPGNAHVDVSRKIFLKFLVLKMYHSACCLQLQMVFLAVSVCASLLRGTSFILDKGPNLLHYEHILINYVCNTILKQDLILRKTQIIVGIIQPSIPLG